MEVICIQLSNLDVKNKWPPSCRKNVKKKTNETKKEMGTKDILKNDRKRNPIFLSHNF